MNAVLVPHPVLSPDSTDYRAGLSFDMSLTDKPRYTLDSEILVPVRFDLESRFVRRLIRNRKARITVVVKCPRTYERATFGVDGTETTLKLPLGRYADKIWLSPYVSATVPIERFKSAEHHAEFSGMEISLPAGAILARGSDTELTIDSLQTLSAAIRLMTNNDLEKGQYYVDVEGDHIEISMHEETRRGVESLRKANPHVLYPSIYMAALTHAIQNVTPTRNRKWADALRKTLEKNGMQVDDEDELKNNAYAHAQRLLKYPIKYITEPAGGGAGSEEVDDDE